MQLAYYYRRVNRGLSARRSAHEDRGAMAYSGASLL
jgi:hypothetical protein